MIETDRIHIDKLTGRPAFTLVETIVVVTLAAMLLAAVLQIYGRVRGDSAVILEKLDENRKAQEILQRIAEDVDRMTAPGFDAVIQVRNKVDNGYYAAQIDMNTKYYNSDNPPKPQVYERVIWHSAYDILTDMMTLYRMHGGLNMEDKVLDQNRKPEEMNLYIPIAAGVTFFEAQAMENRKPIHNWIQEKPPRGIRVGISFALPEPLPDGGTGIPENKILYRTIAVDRTRSIAYTFTPKIYDVNDFLMEEPNPEEEPVEEEMPAEEPGEPILNPLDEM